MKNVYYNNLYNDLLKSITVDLMSKHLKKWRLNILNHRPDE